MEKCQCDLSEVGRGVVLGWHGVGLRAQTGHLVEHDLHPLLVADHRRLGVVGGQMDLIREKVFHT